MMICGASLMLRIFSIKPNSARKSKEGLSFFDGRIKDFFRNIENKKELDIFCSRADLRGFYQLNLSGGPGPDS